jgi:hypothetical protein
VGERSYSSEDPGVARADDLQRAQPTRRLDHAVASCTILEAWAPVARRGLQVFLVLLGLVAMGAGSLAVLTGGAFVQGGEFNASIDSELRFYAAWYVGAGGVLLASARDVGRAGLAVRAVGALLWLGATGRLISIAMVGAPHPVFFALMLVEYAIPLVLVPWQAAVARRIAPSVKRTAGLRKPL